MDLEHPTKLDGKFSNVIGHYRRTPARYRRRVIDEPGRAPQYFR
jgi:hypothetical protein